MKCHFSYKGCQNEALAKDYDDLATNDRASVFCEWHNAWQEKRTIKMMQKLKKEGRI